MATLNEKLTALERRIEYIEARVSEDSSFGRYRYVTPFTPETNTRRVYLIESGAIKALGY